MRLSANRLPTSPGEMLKKEFLVAFRMDEEEFARRMEMSLSDVKKIIAGETRIDKEIAAKLSRAFRTTAYFWENCQEIYEKAFEKYNKNKK